MKKTMLIGVLMLSGMLTMAQTTTGVNNTQKNQVKRIAHGVASGDLTRKETHQLVHQQRQIQRQKRMAKADGVITRRERMRLSYSQSKANANIYRKKHNVAGRKHNF